MLVLSGHEMQGSVARLVAREHSGFQERVLEGRCETGAGCGEETQRERGSEEQLDGKVAGNQGEIKTWLGERGPLCA